MQAEAKQPQAGQKSGDRLRTFYRVLYTRENFKDWIEGRYRSGHLSPLDRFAVAQTIGSTKAEDYPLQISTGCYSEAARSAFLNAAREGRLDKLTDEESRAICEVGGVCAYDTPEHAYAYLEHESPARRANTDRYVEFLGEKLCDDQVEGKGAVIARVIQPVGGMLDREEFRRKHRLNAT